MTRAGDCLPLTQFETSDVYVTISLYAPIIVTHVTIEHINRELVLNWNSAPKEFVVYGSNNQGFNDPKVLLTETFDINGHYLQTFETSVQSKRSFQYIKFSISSNYGSEYTCIYRLRVHGIPEESYSFVN